jgi:hypothetical protein
MPIGRAFVMKIFATLSIAHDPPPCGINRIAAVTEPHPALAAGVQMQVRSLESRRF